MLLSQWWVLLVSFLAGLGFKQVFPGCGFSLGGILVFIVKLSVTKLSFQKVQSSSKIGPLDLTTWNNALVIRVLYLIPKQHTPACFIREPPNANSCVGVFLSDTSFKCLNGFKGIRLLSVPVSTLAFT